MDILLTLLSNYIHTQLIAYKNLWGNYLLYAGIPIDKVALLDQETRNYVGKKLLELTLMELFIFRFMQASCLPPSRSLSLSI